MCVCVCRSDSADSLPADQQEQVGRLQDPGLHRRQDQPHRPRPQSVSHMSCDLIHLWERNLQELVLLDCFWSRPTRIFVLSAYCMFAMVCVSHQDGHAAQQVQNRLLWHQRPGRHQHQTQETQVRPLMESASAPWVHWNVAWLIFIHDHVKVSAWQRTWVFKGHASNWGFWLTKHLNKPNPKRFMNVGQLFI